MKKNIYQNKTTGQIIVTGEKLSGQHWNFLRHSGEMEIKNGMMKKDEVIKKKNNGQKLYKRGKN